MLELTANDPLIKTYLKDLQHLKDHSVSHELGLKAPFQNLLDKAAKKRGWTPVRLVGQVRVSMATVQIVKSLPA